MRTTLIKFVLAGVISFLPSVLSANEKTYVYAASSLTGAMTQAATTFEAETHQRITLVFGASSTLARQIIQGAPANLYVSANSLWMDMVAGKGLIEADSRHDIAGNRLALVAPVSDSAFLDVLDPNALMSRLGKGHLAIADPRHVPAGMYAEKALRYLKLWSLVKSRLATASNVRIALAYVERNEVPLGVVYASDLYGRTKIKIVAMIPETSHPRIRYPMAVIKANTSPTAIAFQRFLQSSKGRAILTQFGFQAL